MKKITADSELHKILQLWAGAAFLNIDYQAGIDELIKNEMISIAERNLDELGLDQFKKYLDLYYTKEGPFRMSRSFEF